jgi:hypothetical protein
MGEPMSGTFLLPENNDVNKDTATLKIICDFVDKTTNNKSKCGINEISDNIGLITTIDKQFVIEHGDDFGAEMREIGTSGLYEKYKGRSCIHIYGEIPFWLTGMIEDLLKARFLHCKCKDKDRW